MGNTFTIKIHSQRVDKHDEKKLLELYHLLTSHVSDFYPLEQVQITFLSSIEQSTIPIDIHPRLSERQRQVAKLLIEHYSIKRIAELMFISENTVKKHIQNIKKELNLDKTGGDFVYELNRELGKYSKSFN
ncbi:response regulator transcription factor [Paenibacillus sp. GSMTC-2017]|uniref:LuxR C-terminal-related transcriptional regulator n=1 Tax=Paenibacillus sp. GSMTC-2017 TaxID=2794350 RepID=UPI0018D62038|nr:LuxR C-terminal-related transcriptional regulator [Paenibacillus sp. GSMTC-2017]MBH5320096.1 response regulator transcription factor [Paenibacillus sp. GSMTC-2017]